MQAAGLLGTFGKAHVGDLLHEVSVLSCQVTHYSTHSTVDNSESLMVWHEHFSDHK